MIRSLWPLPVLTGLGLLFFGQLVLHPTQVLYSDHSDLLAEHIPAKRFLARSWQEAGELPLWCPHNLAGTPFLHDPQVALFYPPHWLLMLLPETSVGWGLSWLIVAHVILAGWNMYWYVRSRGLTALAGVVAAMGYMFAGKWMLHLLAAGHYITIGMAWLPLVLLLLEAALRRRSLLLSTAAGVAYALMVLGTQPQWTFYAGLFIALWTLTSVIDHAWVEGSWRVRGMMLTRWLAYGAWVVAVALSLSAVQLLPTLEAAGLSTRAGGVGTNEVLEGGVRSFLFLVGPALRTTPSCLMWEDRGGFGLLWLAAAALAPVLCRGRVRWQAAICVALMLFAFGGALAFQGLPGFNLFRQPTRMLLIAVFPVSFLAGITTDALFGPARLAGEMSDRCSRVVTRLAGATILLVGGFALRTLLEGESVRFHVYWMTLLLTVPVMCWFLKQASRSSSRLLRGVWIGVLLIDAWALAWPLVDVRSEPEVYPVSDCVALLADKAMPGERILDRDAPELSAGTPLGAGAPLAMLHGMEPLRGYNPLDNRRYKEFLALMGDEERELVSLRDPLTYPILGNFPVVNKPLLDLLGVKYLLQPASMEIEGDGWRALAHDPHPRGYDFITGGVQPLPPYRVYENTLAFPRAFVVGEAQPLPSRPDVLEKLKTTDPRRCVFLEDWQPALGTRSGNSTGSEKKTESGLARLVEYRPNRVVVDVNLPSPGYLVLTDLWYPGWVCFVDGVPSPLYRADYLFRATPVDAGHHEVTFVFAPESYRTGRRISVIALGIIALLSLAALVNKGVGVAIRTLTRKPL